MVRAKLIIAVLIILTGKVWAEPLKLVIDHQFPPYTMQMTDGSLAGIYYEIVSGALNTAGIKYDAMAAPWKRLVEMTDANALDLSIPWREKEERFEKYNMVGPLTPSGSRTVFWQRIDDPTIEWSNLNDLVGKRIGIVSGFAYPKDFEQAGYLNKLSVVKSDLLIQLLDKKRVDLIIGDEHVLFAEAGHLGLINRFRVSGKPVDTTKRYIVVPKNKKELAERLQVALDAFQQTNAFRSILRRYRM